MGWVPNALTGLRIVLIPVVLALLPRVEAGTGALATARLVVVGLFFLLAITDWLDGYLARRLHATSRWGGMADAAADRLALLLPLLYFAIREPAAFPQVPLWMPVWLVALDLITGLAWVVARARAGVRPPRSHTPVGRAAVWILFTLVLWALAGLPSWGVLVLGSAGLGLATLSSGIYVRRWLAR